MGLVSDLPPGTLRYVNLFKVPNSERAMSWNRAKRLLTDLKTLVSAGWVRSSGKPDRSCNPKQWGEAMSKMIDNLPSRLPLKNHNYLIAVAYDLADTADRQTEMLRNRAERTGSFVAPEPAQERISPEEMKAIRKAAAARGKCAPEPIGNLLTVPKPTPTGETIYDHAS